ncbi:ArnT family glycosyltransferase [Methylobacterium haplocladii]|uniref:Glycosyl transferase n=1 Tax=Methylobacterium haplocladii TaxID=1176176 RepID=A0A512IK62_9HYPH|nr:glycosyltransferase family 39 protein [Methylobacterium haplocladii]GEO98113.1 glycosyl transferase [Methylobacterium haplocladii]
MASLTASGGAPLPPSQTGSARLTGITASASRRASGVLDSAERGHLRACALLLVIALVCFLPGFVSLQPMDRDEPRFAQASKQMLETGDFVDIRFQGEARHKKPVGIYWAQAATVAVGEALGIDNARTTIALYRLPSLIGALAASLIAYWAALAFMPRRGAVLAAALFTACLMLSAEARLAKTDALLTACAVAAMGALARAWLGRVRLERERAPPSRGTALIFWLAVALGILVKGPMVPLFAGLAALVLAIREQSWRWLLALRPLPGFVLTLAIVAPWFLAIAWKSGGAFYGEAVGHDMLAKVGTGAEKHWAPPGAYLGVFFATFWPGAAFAVLSVPFAWRNRREDAVAFLLAWIVPAWLLFEAVPTKLPHYVLPLMPAVAILTVLALAGAPVSRRRWETVVAGLVVAVPFGITIGLIGVGWQLDRTVPWLGLPLLLAACALAALAWAMFARGVGEGALVLAVGAGAVLSAGVFGLSQTEVPALKLSPRLAAIRDGLPCEAVQTASLGYREPSLVFLIGTNLATPSTGAEAAAFLRAGGCRLVFVESRYAQDFATATAGLDATRVGVVSGFNINTGRRTELSAYATGLAGAPAP